MRLYISPYSAPSVSPGRHQSIFSGIDRDAGAPLETVRLPTNQRRPISITGNFFFSQATHWTVAASGHDQNFRQFIAPSSQFSPRDSPSQANGRKDLISNHNRRRVSISLAPLPLCFTMAPLATASRLCVRSAAVAKPAVRALSSTAVRQADAPGAGAASYTSPFKGESKANKIPDFSKYMSKGSETSNKLFSYFMVGTMGAITAAGAKSTVQGGFECLTGFPLWEVEVGVGVGFGRNWDM